MATTSTLNPLYAQVESQLDQVRGEVLRHWTDAFRLVYGASAEPPRLGGKMLRPAFTILSAGAIGAPELDEFVDMATAMELLHLAALAHDDVVDNANIRRGDTSLNALWDNHTAVLGGDYLVARALRVLTRYDSCPVIASALDSIHEMAEGELITFGRGKENLGPEDCILLAKKKTAALFAVACCTPSLLIDLSYRKPLHDFGMGLGTAFQIVDDLLDLEQDEATLGKPSCADIVEGKTTLPILYIRESLSMEEILHYDSLEGEPLSAADREWIAQLLERSGARERCEGLANRYVADALAALEALPQNAYVESMRGLLEFVVIRNS